jgi:hypothetical protein
MAKYIHAVFDGTGLEKHTANKARYYAASFLSRGLKLGFV